MNESAARPAPLSTAAAARRVFELSFGEMLWSRRTIFMALVVGGPVLLAATSLPWLGATCRATATGLPANSLAIGVFGFGTLAAPLPAILPQGVAGCSLLVTPDLLTLLVPQGGTVTTSYTIADNAAFLGFVFHEQVAPIEFDAAGNLVAVTASNGLTFTKGAF